MIEIIDMNKKYRTREGRAVRVLCVDAPIEPLQCVVAIVEETGRIHRYTRDGRYSPDGRMHTFDLIEVKEPLRLWCNVICQHPFIAAFYEDKQRAESYHGPQHEPEIMEFVEVVK